MEEYIGKLINDVNNSFDNTYILLRSLGLSKEIVLYRIINKLKVYKMIPIVKTKIIEISRCLKFPDREFDVNDLFLLATFLIMLKILRKRNMII